MDAADDIDDLVDAISKSLSKLDVDMGSISIKGKSSKICVGGDVRLIMVGELKIFNGESNVIVGMSASSTSAR